MKKIVLVLLMVILANLVIATVQNSSWDGSVYQVKMYLKDNLKDPKSVEYIEWSDVIKEGKYYIVRCKYRARNSFGGYTIENKLFYIDAYTEEVVYYVDY